MNVDKQTYHIGGLESQGNWTIELILTTNTYRIVYSTQTFKNEENKKVFKKSFLQGFKMHIFVLLINLMH